MSDSHELVYRHKLVYKIVYDGVRVGMGVRFIPGVNEVLKKLNGVWLPSVKMWIFQYEDALKIANNGKKLLAPLAEKANIDNLPGFLRRVMSKPTPFAFAAALDVKMFRLTSGHIIVLSAYDRALVRAIGKFLRYDRSNRMWYGKANENKLIEELRKVGVDADSIYRHEDLLTEFDPDDWREPFKPSMRVGSEDACLLAGNKEEKAQAEDALKKAWQTVNQPLSLIEVDVAALDEAVKRFGLYDYQRDGVYHLVSATSRLLADDMGLGKTRQSIVAAWITSQREGCAVLIVCPASLRVNWQREINKLLPTDVVGIVGERLPDKPIDWLIVSYESMGRVVRQIEAGELKFSVMIIDEAHYLKEPGNGRTQNAFRLAKSIPHRYLLTGTPVLNREAEVHTILRLSGHPIGELPPLVFKRLYSGSTNARSNLSVRIAEWMLRRRKSDVLKTLKGKRHEIITVDPPVGFREQYDILLHDKSQPTLVKIGKARRLIEESKTDFILDVIQGLSYDDKVIVFCQFLSSVDIFSAAFMDAGIEFSQLTGKSTMSQRVKAIDRFQTDPAVRVFLATTDAAYAGINLTAANYVIFASLPWTPAKKNQAEDRAYRNGQERLVTVIIPLFADTIDEPLMRLLEYKASLANDITAASEVETEDQMEDQEDREDSIALQIGQQAGFGCLTAATAACA